MSSMGSLGRVFSGLHASQAGLYVTGHNISNVDSEGYSRQQVMQSDSRYVKIKESQTSIFSVGLGANITDIRQIRDIFIDAKYRKEVSKAAFYDVKKEAVNEIESIIGEMHGDSRLSNAMSDIWKSLQELSGEIDGVATRGIFISSAEKFIEKAGVIYEGLVDYQIQLNTEIISQVNQINSLTEKIHELNEKIASAEISGDNANDFRDERNLYIDKIAAFASITVREDSTGRANLYLEGNDLVTRAGATHIGLRYVTPGSPFVEPVFTNLTRILEHDDPYALSVFGDLANKKVDAGNDNDYGSLKSLLLCRGYEPANYTYSEAEVDNFLIPKMQRELDILVNKMVTMFNDMMSPMIEVDPGPPPVYESDPNGPQDLNGNTGIELFVRKMIPRYDENGEYINEPDINDPNYDRYDPNNIKLLYTTTNLMVNPLLKNDNTLLPLSPSGDRSDNTLVEEMLSLWQSDSSDYSPSANSKSPKLSFGDYYNDLMSRLGLEGDIAGDILNTQTGVINKLNNDRGMVSGVSLDEEMTEMMKYQHAYNAAARMVNVIDSMLDHIIHKTGRVGI